MFLKRYKNLYKFKPYFAKYKSQTILLVICMIIASSMGMVLAYLMSEQLSAISNINISKMVKSTVFILVAVLVHHTTWFFWDKISAIIGNKVANDIRNDIFSNALSTQYQIIKNNSTGYYIERLNDDTNEISFFVQNVYGTLVDVATNFTFLIIIFFLNWQCGLFFSIGLIVLYFLDVLKIKVELKHTKKIKVLSERLNSKMTEAIRSIKDIKGLGIKNEVCMINGEISKQLAVKNTKMKVDVTLLERLRTFCQWAIDCSLVFLCAFWLFPTGQIDVLVILIIFNYKSLMYDTIGFFSKLKGYYVQGDFKAQRILEVLNDDIKDVFGNNTISNKKSSIKVKNLSFSYGDKKVLKNISLKLKENTATLLIGESGSGKSIFFSLLTKLNPVKNGKIFIDDVDLNNLGEEELTKHISIVNQEPFVFNDTLYNNLRIVKPTATKDEIYTACKNAHIYDEVVSMKDGFNTILAENGSNLSGGQKQRLSIARAILKNTPIILFDEPTSALDGENQKKFLATIKQLKNDKIIFVIAHNIQNTSVFDKVIEISDGKIKSTCHFEKRQQLH